MNITQTEFNKLELENATGKIYSSFVTHIILSTFYVTAECHLPDIENLSPQTQRRIPHNSKVQLSCGGGFAPRGVSKRTCMLGKLHPDFHSHPFVCG